MMQTQQASHGVSFRTDLSKVGSQTGKSALFGGGGGGVLNEERRLIDKVFAIVDKDNSGSVDIEELKGMFKLFNVEASFLESAISRIMSNVDKDSDYTISPQEFYSLLSQKFEKGDSKDEIASVFNRMDKNHDGALDVDELHEVATMLGETIPKSEIKDMIKMFSTKYQTELKDYNKNKKKNPSSREPAEPTSINLQEFFEVMQEEL
jgi:Ca2+-binding EF-hand superfamily protein